MHFNFAIVGAENHGRKTLPSSFIYIVLIVGQDPGRPERSNIFYFIEH